MDRLQRSITIGQALISMGSILATALIGSAIAWGDMAARVHVLESARSESEVEQGRMQRSIDRIDRNLIRLSDKLNVDSLEKPQ
jgi:hypothetical protein